MSVVICVQSGPLPFCVKDLTMLIFSIFSQHNPFDLPPSHQTFSERPWVTRCDYSLSKITHFLLCWKINSSSLISDSSHKSPLFVSSLSLKFSYLQRLEEDFQIVAALTYFAREAREYLLAAQKFLYATPNFWLLGVALRIRCGAKAIQVWR